MAVTPAQAGFLATRPSRASVAARAPKFSLGFRVRLRKIPGVTNKAVLHSAVYLPATLGDTEVQEEANHQDYDTPRRGQFSQAAGGDNAEARQLRTIPIDIYAPDNPDMHLLPGGWTEPEDVRSMLEQILRYRTPFEILMTRALTGGGPTWLLMYATMRNLGRTLKFGEPTTAYMSVQLSEWRRQDLLEDSTVGPSGKALPATHRLTTDDSLSSLSEFYYGSASYWRIVARANGVTSFGQSSPLVGFTRFHEGSLVRIPTKPRTTTPTATSGKPLAGF